MADPGESPKQDSRPSTPNEQSGTVELNDLLNTPTSQIGVHQPGFASHATPISKIEDNSRDSFPNPTAGARYLRFSDEMQNWFVGPIPSANFVELCFPASSIEDDNMPDAVGAFKEIKMNERDEKKLYIILRDAINDYGRCPGFFLADTSVIPQTSGSGSMKPDLCLFSDDAPRMKIIKDERTGKFIAHFGFAEIFIEIKINPGKNDPFSDFVQTLTDDSESSHDSDSSQQNHEFLKDDNKNNTTSTNIGQTVAYSSETCARQHRTHCFSISVYGSTARLFRWDRSGVIISDLIDLHKNPEILCRFMWRYSQATDPQRGYDTSVKVATPGEENVFKKVITEHIKEQLCPADGQIEGLIKEHYEPDAVFKIPIEPHQVTIEQKNLQIKENISSAVPKTKLAPWDEVWYKDVEKSDGAQPLEALTDTGISSTVSAETTHSEHIHLSGPSSLSRRYRKPQEFLVSVPITTPLTNTGHGTREYWAVKLPDESIGETDYSIAFLKDTWRIVTDGIENEGEMMVEMIESNVKFVSDVYCYGDVIDESKTRHAEISKTSDQGIDNLKSETRDVETSEPSDKDAEDSNIYQCTLTDRYISEKWNTNHQANVDSKQVIKRVHFRMASVVVGYPLHTFRGMKELIHGGRCAFLAAWAADKLLSDRYHRDISLRNIFLVKKRGNVRVGFLFNWELSKKKNTDISVRMYTRTATWAFLSINALSGNQFPHTFQDDMESFYYIILYASVLWMPHISVLDNIEEHILEFFDQHIRSGRQITGGRSKTSDFVTRDFSRMFRFENKYLQKWLDVVHGLQRPYVKGQLNPKWTPEALHAIWMNIDEAGLPTDDKVENRNLQKKKRGRKKQKVVTKIISSATRPSVRSGSSASAISTPISQISTGVEPQISSHRYNTRFSSSKRLRVSLGIAGPSQSFKRRRNVDVQEDVENVKSNDTDNGYDTSDDEYEGRT